VLDIDFEADLYSDFEMGFPMNYLYSQTLPEQFKD
jgi:hypothetical protein